MLRRGSASVTYRLGAEVPLLRELDKYGLAAVPVSAVFDNREASRYSDRWAEARGQARGEARGQAQTILKVLKARRLTVPERVREQILACTDLTTLDRWVELATAAGSAEAFARELG